MQMRVLSVFFLYSRYLYEVSEDALHMCLGCNEQTTYKNQISFTFIITIILWNDFRNLKEIAVKKLQATPKNNKTENLR